MKKRLLFCLLIAVSLLLSSCDPSILSIREESIDQYPDGKPLDVQKLLENKAKWKALDIKNYTFTYKFQDSMNGSGRYKEYKGIVIVKNGKGSLYFDKRSRIPSKNNPYERKFFVMSIEDVFDKILEDYLRLKTMKDRWEIDYLDARYEWYDYDCFFLERVEYTPFRFSSSTGPRKMHFQIVDFNVFD